MTQIFLPNRYAALLGAVLIVGTTSLTSCDDRRRHQPDEEPAFTGSTTSMPADSMPESIALQFLKAAAEAQQSRATGLGDPQRKSAYDHAMIQVGQLSARSLIHQRLKASGGMQVPKDITEAAAVALISESWVSMLAHYSAGIHFETLRQTSSPGMNPVTVVVEATNPDEARRLGELEASLATASSQPGGAGTVVRVAALRTGMNVPICAGIELKLAKLPQGYRVVNVALVPCESHETLKTTR